MDWISTSDRLPDDDITVLVALAYRGGQPEEMSMAYHSDGRWWSADDSGRIFMRVTHWADLPELPTEESK